jgi:prepilin-type processing-associated H-X9-DG protein
MSCSNNLKQLGLAMHSYHDVNNFLPLGMPDDDGRSWSWRVRILPFIEQEPALRALQADTARFQLVAPDNGPNPGNVNIDGIATSEVGNGGNGINAGNGVPRNIIKTYICPSDTLPDRDNTGFAKANYCGNSGTNLRWTIGAWNGCAQVKGSAQDGLLVYSNDNIQNWGVNFASITDGLSNTVSIGEASDSENVSQSNLADGAFPVWAGGNDNGGCNGWRSGGNALRLMETVNFAFGISSPGFPLNSGIRGPFVNGQSNAAFGSRHSGGANFALGDGSVRFVRDSISPAAYRAAGSRNGGETLTLDN